MACRKAVSAGAGLPRDCASKFFAAQAANIKLVESGLMLDGFVGVLERDRGRIVAARAYINSGDQAKARSGHKGGSPHDSTATCNI